jgi:hypothetical protein
VFFAAVGCFHVGGCCGLLGGVIVPASTPRRGLASILLPVRDDVGLLVVRRNPAV